MNKIENILDNIKNVNKKNNILNVERDNKSFWESNFGKIINGAIDFGIKATLPRWMQNEIIEIKDSILTDGIQAGVQTAADKVVDIGKSIQGIFTGDFESISQINRVINNGGLIDAISDLLDSVINWAKKENKISNKTSKIIKSSKNTLLSNIEKSISNSMESQLESIEKINNYIEKWNQYYKENDLTNMKKIHTRIKNEMQKIMPIENVLKKVEYVNNLQELIQKNGGNFNLSEEELELAELLS